MTEALLNHLAAFISGLGGIVLGAGIIKIWLNRTLSDYASLKKRVEENVEQELLRQRQELAECEQRQVDLARRLTVLEERVEPLNVPLLNQKIETIDHQVLHEEGKLEQCLQQTTILAERVKNLKHVCDNNNAKIRQLEEHIDG